jgi:hypothetical protein
MLSIAGASSASAGKSIKPKGSATAIGAVSPIRAGAIGSIPFAQLSVPKTQAPATTLVVVTSPQNARVLLAATPGVLTTLADDSATLTAPDTSLLPGVDVGTYNATADDSVYGVAVDVAGSYTAQLGNGTDTTTFSFTTAGAPASLAITPATQTVLIGQTANLVVEVKDAAGRFTQVANGDSISLADNSSDTVTPTSLAATSLFLGAAPIELATQAPAGTTTVTATPAGTLPSQGLVPQTATVTKSGSIASNSVKSITVSSPSNAINLAPGVAQVPSPTLSVTVTIDDTTVAPAGNQIRLAATTNSVTGTVNGKPHGVVDYQLVTTNASKQATATFVLGGGAAINGGDLFIEQVDVNGNATTVGGPANITVDVLTPAVYPTSVTVNPNGYTVAKADTETPVTVTVDDSFGNHVAGWAVTAVRAPSTVLTTGVTDASGKATVSVKPLNAAATTETYAFIATNPVTGAQVTSSEMLYVTYTPTGAIASLSAQGAGGAEACSNTSCALDVVPQLAVPSGGIVDAATTALWSLKGDDSVGGVAPGTYSAITISTTPGAAATVTAPPGVKVSADQPNASTLWSDGGQTATIPSNGSTGTVYVWATKTGTHDVTVTAGGLTVTYKVHVVNSATDAYNIAVTPPKQAVKPGAIGTLTVKVTDVFGNAIRGSGNPFLGANTDPGAVYLTASGAAVFGGLLGPTNAVAIPNSAGESTVTFIAGNAAGAALITATPVPGSSATPAWQAGYVAPTGAPKPVTSAIAEITVGTVPSTKSITITGSRTTVSGKPGIKVDGVTVGIEDGKTVTPFIRFPGQTTFEAGSARPAVSGDEVTWQRKTGKRVTVYFELTEDSSVRSNRVTIQAS